LLQPITKGVLGAIRLSASSSMISRTGRTSGERQDLREVPCVGANVKNWHKAEGFGNATTSVESTTGAVVADAGEWPLAGSAGASIRVITPFPVAARRTGHVDLPHPALGQGITLSPTEGRASLATDA